MKRWVKTFAIVVVVLAAIPLLIFVYLEMREERDREAEMEKPVKERARVEMTADREIVVKLDAEAQGKAALKTEPLAGASLRPESEAHGRFEEDPASSFTLRAPIAGILRPVNGRNWPGLGENLDAGLAVGTIEPRLAPVDRVDLASRLATARAEVDSRTASAATAKAALERVRTLNAEEKAASDRALQEAELRVKEVEAQLRAAGETAKLIEASLAPTDATAASLPLRINQGGRVVSLLARPGEVVECGQEILRVSNVDRLIARAWVPASEALGDPASARLLPLGFEDRPLQGTVVGRGDGPGQVLLLRVESSGLPLRPGMAFQAWLATPGDAKQGVTVPRAALVRFGGRTWAYVQTGDTTFVRREIASARPVAGGWFVSQGFAAGDRVVTVGAQVLLSEELKSQIQVGEEEMRKG